ncbi:MAG: lipocalin family protein [Bacteroidales bacterium]|nr:lipocalin family protein [Bacteroidales bacterium]MCF8344906.1 lipocalin family protein [Bacteroidales bacterium]MCF8349943.1 lipocalin family protein [Bacteroidales bacterium]MCF8375460.1 lipocalin family protein [Bacteroidales bacterium]MCF8402110.1 lipocalin family protein [Bacteroidales bacterium]
MKAKRSLFLNILIALILLSGTIQAKWYTDSRFKFKIDVPSNWTSNIYTEGTDKVYDFTSPDQNIAIQLRAFEAGDGVSAKVISDLMDEGITGEGASQVNRSQDEINGTKGELGVYTNNFDGQDMVLITFSTVQNNIGYMFLIVVPSNVLDQKSAEIDAILNTFTINSVAQVRIDKPATQQLTIGNIILGKTLSGKTNLSDITTEFNTDTPVFYAVFDWTGNGYGKSLEARWIFADGNVLIDRVYYDFPNQKGGSSNTSLSIPDDGWPEGNYSLELYMDGNLVKSKNFTVVEKTDKNMGGLLGGTSVGGSGSDDVTGKYNFVSRSDGKSLVNYHYIQINSNGTYSEKYNPKNSGSYVGGTDGTWKVNGNQLINTHQGGRISDTYTINGNELIRVSDDGVKFTFRK